MKEKYDKNNQQKQFARWLNLGLVGIFTFLLVFIGMQFYLEGWCASCDYCAFLSAGQIINDGRFSDIYNLELLENYQREIFTAANSMTPEFDVLAILYLPIFILPFRFFALLGFKVGLFLSIAINILGFIFYLRFFVRKVFSNQSTVQLLLIILLSLPVFQTVFYGQPNLLLVVSLGEFIRALLSDKRIKAGLWLGALLIKPHLLLLLLPFLLLQRRFKVLRGFVVSALVVFGISMALVGVDGLIGLKDAVLQAAGGGVSSNPMFMMNWRMLGIYISTLTLPVVGEVFTIGLSILTAVIPLIVFRKKIEVGDPEFGVAFLAVMAATALIAPHVHIHTSVILLPFIMLSFLQGELAKSLLYFWSFFPTAINFLLYLIGAGIKSGLLPDSFAIVVLVAYGTSMLIANITLLAWAIRWRKEKTPLPEVLAVFKDNE